MHAEETVGFAARFDGGVENAAVDREGLAGEFVFGFSGLGGGGDRETGKQSEVAGGIGSAGVMRVREIQAGGLQILLDFREIRGFADFTEADDIRRVAGEDCNDCLLFALGFRSAFEGFPIDVAIHRQPVFDVVGDEAKSSWGDGFGGNRDGFRGVGRLDVRLDFK